MKIVSILEKFVAATLFLALLVTTATVDAQQARYKMTTDIPASIITPDVVETSLGTLSFFDGFPDDATVQKVYDNLDSSVDVWFGPEPPAGKEANWIQTVPGKGWFLMLRIYGPLEPWFDQTWRPGEIELME